MNNKIKNVFARYILDSRANPTVEVEITLEDGSLGRAAVPSGASTGKLEAHELRDEFKEFNGKGVSKAVQNVNRVVSDANLGKDAKGQAEINKILIDLDVSDNKSTLAAKTILAFSMAWFKAVAASMWSSVCIPSIL